MLIHPRLPPAVALLDDDVEFEITGPPALPFVGRWRGRDEVAEAMREFATALERHLGWRYAVPGYIFASYVAASRLPADRHWLSDVVFGSAVGIIAGRTVTANETAKFPVTVAYVPGGAAVLFVRR